jgi:hypothetical protein
MRRSYRGTVLSGMLCSCSSKLQVDLINPLHHPPLPLYKSIFPQHFDLFLRSHVVTRVLLHHAEPAAFSIWYHQKEANQGERWAFG